MKMIDRLRSRRSTSRQTHAINRALRAAPSQAMRDEILIFAPQLLIGTELPIGTHHWPARFSGWANVVSGAPPTALCRTRSARYGGSRSSAKDRAVRGRLPRRGAGRATGLTVP
jgi:hypothetical protein